MKQKVIGLCKALTCADFLPAILPMLLEQLDAIVFVLPNKDWLGNEKENVVTSFIMTDPFVSSHMGEEDSRIHLVGSDSIDQMEQYNAGYAYIKENFDADWIFIFDTDEVWDDASLQTLLQTAEKENIANGLSSLIYTYVKSPFYQVEPQEPLTPCVMFRPIYKEVPGIRGNGALPMKIVDLAFHHFSYVRATEQELLDKITVSTHADNIKEIVIHTVNLDVWKKEKWDKMPNVTNFHTSNGFQKNWHKLRVVDKTELPYEILELPIVKKFEGAENE